MSELAFSKSSVGAGKLECPQELVGFLEVRSSSVDFVNQIFDGDDSEFAQVLFNDSVIAQWDTLTVDLGVSTLVDQFTNSLQVWFTVCNVWFDQLEHLLGCLCQFDKSTVVDLQQTQQLQDLAWLRCNVGDTAQTNDKGDLWLSRNVKVSFGLGNTAKTDFFTFTLLVFLGVRFSTLEDDTALSFLSLLGEKMLKGSVNCFLSIRSPKTCNSGRLQSTEECASRFRPERWLIVDSIANG